MKIIEIKEIEIVIFNYITLGLIQFNNLNILNFYINIKYNNILYIKIFLLKEIYINITKLK